MNVRVVKVGGSLLEWPPQSAADSLPRRLNAWLQDNSDAMNVLIAGGGKAADWIRQLDARFELGEQVCHGICVRLLGATATVLGELLPDARRVASFDDLPAAVSQPGRVVVFDPVTFLECVEPQLSGPRLGSSWRVTSDSIAARLAQVRGYSELVLLKSTAAPADATLEQLAETGYVDGDFPKHARELSVRLVNLRGRLKTAD